MAKAKLKMVVCPVRVACDGAEMTANREMCGLCRKKLAQKGRKAPPAKFAKVG